MKLHALLFLLCHGLILVCLGQSYSALLEKADSAYNVKSFKVCGEYYEQAIPLSGDRIAVIHFNAACAFSLSGDLAKSAKYLKVSLDAGDPSITLSDVMKEKDLDQVRRSPYFRRYLEDTYSAGELEFIASEQVSYASLVSYIESRASKGDHFIAIDDKTIYWQKRGNGYSLNDLISLKIPRTPHVRLVFRSCNFQLHLLWLEKSNEQFNLTSLDFESCKFFGKVQLGNTAAGEFFYTEGLPTFTKCEFHYYTSISLRSFNGDYESNCRIEDCKFGSLTFIDFSNSSSYSVDFKNISFFTDTSSISISGKSMDRLSITGYSFKQTNELKLHEASINRFLIEKDSLDYLVLDHTSINQEFTLDSTRVKGFLLMQNSSFPDGPTNSIDWTPLSNGRLGIYRWRWINLADGMGFPLLEPITGQSEKDVSNGKDFRQLMGTYSMFLNLYRAKNDLEAYNSCYITMKEIQTRRLYYLYQSHKTFESYFRWKLSELLKFYVHYGTDPARAIVISIYIIIGFGAFFFFFPSDWDVTSKSRLLKNYKDFVERNKKGYLRPFFVLLLGFLLSLINAVTLSLNAFITLGFGNIPTHGLARYICVLEGFLGWFLLSIFTVALINQVL